MTKKAPKPAEDRADDHREPPEPVAVVEPEGLPKAAPKRRVTAETEAAVERRRAAEHATRAEIERLTAEKVRREREAAEMAAVAEVEGDTVPGAVDLMTELQAAVSDPRYRVKREKAFHLTDDEARWLREKDAAIDRDFRVRVAGVTADPVPHPEPPAPVKTPKPADDRPAAIAPPSAVLPRRLGWWPGLVFCAGAALAWGAATVLLQPAVAVCDTAAVKQAALAVFLKEPAAYTKLRTDWDTVLAEGLAVVVHDRGGVILSTSAVLAVGGSAVDVTDDVTVAVLAAAKGDAR